MRTICVYLVIKLKERFSKDSLLMGVSVDNFFHLRFEENNFFIDHYPVHFQSYKSRGCEAFL